jgi:hypothetical protein
MYVFSKLSDINYRFEFFLLFTKKREKNCFIIFIIIVFLYIMLFNYKKKKIMLFTPGLGRPNLY